MELARRVTGVLVARLKSYQDKPYELEIEAAARLFDIDLEILRADAADQKPYPKSWRAEAEAIEAKARERERARAAEKAAAAAKAAPAAGKKSGHENTRKDTKGAKKGAAPAKKAAAGKTVKKEETAKTRKGK
jgi:hypothetical protein